MITLYDYLPSQNAYKVRLLLSHLVGALFATDFHASGGRVLP